jgi:hypothetical protein
MLDIELDESEVNQKLPFISADTEFEPNLEQYTLDTVEDNYIKFLEESLVAERNLIF